MSDFERLAASFIIPEPRRLFDRGVALDLGLGVLYLGLALVDEAGNPGDWFAWALGAFALGWVLLGAVRYRARWRLREQIRASNEAFRAKWGELAARMAAIEGEQGE